MASRYFVVLKKDILKNSDLKKFIKLYVNNYLKSRIIRATPTGISL